jgi:formylglycine-generating enzyme required for sulfatase activity
MSKDRRRETHRMAAAHRISALVVASAALVIACDDSSKGAKPAGQPPETVSMAGGDLTVGFSEGVQRQSITLPSFRVTKHPITVRDYKACVDAGACSAPANACGQGGGLLDHATFADPDALDVPVTCTKPEQATAYCKWTGGRLPRATEWLLAARGPAVQQHAWGSAPPSCDLHPRVEGVLSQPLSCCDDTDDCTHNTLTRVGAHTAGASPAGVEDVLFAGGEIVTPDEGTALTNCGGKDSTCAVIGRVGAIEALVAWRDPAALSTTFRCAYEEVAR